MDLVYWLLLLKAPDLGLKKFYKVLKHFESPKQVFDATPQQRQQSGLFAKTTLDYLEQTDTRQVQADIDWGKNPDCYILTLIDPRYPAQLKTIPDPPPLLYVRGDVECLSQPQLAIVGSRNPTSGGDNTAQALASDLAKAGLLITSGMATGIDAKAHIGALEAGGKTIAVCGTGLDRIYPSKHKALAHQISIRGALVSEFCIGTSPIANNFPRRNRVISGLSLGVLVVEASIKSGTMITARLSAEQGREVFAIPGSIHNPLSQGCHDLIKQGAKLVEQVEDILQELNFARADTTIQEKTAIKTKEIDKQGSMLLKYLNYDGMTIDQLVEKTGLSPQIVSGELLELELQSKVAKVADTSYILTK